MTDSGHELRDNNEKIVKLMSILKKQRDEMNFLIKKQEDEKSRIQNEIEKLSFKLTLLTKSLSQRLNARNNYDKTIQEIDQSYQGLVVESGKLLNSINKEVQVLEEIMDKRTETMGSTSPTKASVDVLAEKLERIQSGESVARKDDNRSLKSETKSINDARSNRSRPSQDTQSSIRSKSNALDDGKGRCSSVKCPTLQQEAERSETGKESETNIKKVELKSLSDQPARNSNEQDVIVTSYSDLDSKKDDEDNTSSEEMDEREKFHKNDSDVVSYGEAYEKQHSENNSSLRRYNPNKS